jgi:hypothetical protein
MPSLPPPELVMQLVVSRQKGRYAVLSALAMFIWDYGELISRLFK